MSEEINNYCVHGIIMTFLFFTACMILVIYRLKREQKDMDSMKKQIPINSIGWGGRKRAMEQIVEQPKESVFHMVKRIILAETNVAEEEIQEDANLFDIGMDSLDRVNVALAIEDECELEIPDDVFKEIETVGDLVRLIIHYNWWRK
jgi:acyl carrier protein